MKAVNPMERHQTQRMRHETRRRTLTVTGVEMLGPRMKRMTFATDMTDFVSASPDDHIKLFFGDGMRDFTPRAFDVADGTITIDFALHEAGPAMQWAQDAGLGDTLEMGGPRGSAVVPDDFDWYLLVGDETALPAIGRRVEELRADVPVFTVVAVQGAQDEQSFATKAAWQGHWAYRDGAGDDAALLMAALEGIALPPGEGFVWIAGESGVARQLRAYVHEQRGHNLSWVKAAGYWTRGHADTHGAISD
jgi:NADPH-dependent ferric siderophore reductase